MNPEHIRIVLVEPSHPGNIGAVARAMKTMGLGRLVLVAPEQFPHEEATWRAVWARDVLESAVVVDTLDEAIAECGFVVGTCARDQRLPWPVLDPRRSALEVSANSRRGEVAILFGREDNGLSNEELMRCNLHLAIPTSDAYSSLNLAMAVQIVCYELHMLANGDALPQTSNAEWDEPLASQENIERFYVHLEETLSQIGFLNPAAPRKLMPRLRRLYNRLGMDEMELNILRGILTETQKRCEPVDWSQQNGGGS
ncbi:RNA methyltransferase [Congregibacter litoralis]|uniref:tRNA (cytidine/uridine-2'-O-)-methyltransferase TrmJ n=1 Tax=Congregibacter litoralis KT71 TaxID=314285 RepID=A4A471_9GAMM|nr:RNA methyltransferase [Congregibacter litoralis]EAQ99494.1 RNA methyltransferase, TrmH family, group 1 [Congregibacter litoralis KT71]